MSKDKKPLPKKVIFGVHKGLLCIDIVVQMYKHSYMRDVTVLQSDRYNIIIYIYIFGQQSVLIFGVSGDSERHRAFFCKQDSGRFFYSTIGVFADF